MDCSLNAVGEALEHKSHIDGEFYLLRVVVEQSVEWISR